MEIHFRSKLQGYINTQPVQRIELQELSIHFIFNWKLSYTTAPPILPYTTPHQYCVIPQPTNIALYPTPPILRYSSTHQYCVIPHPTNIALFLNPPILRYTPPYQDCVIHHPTMIEMWLNWQGYRLSCACDWIIYCKKTQDCSHSHEIQTVLQSMTTIVSKSYTTFFCTFRHVSLYGLVIKYYHFISHLLPIKPCVTLYNSTNCMCNSVFIKLL